MGSPCPCLWPFPKHETTVWLERAGTRLCRRRCTAARMCGWGLTGLLQRVRGKRIGDAKLKSYRDQVSILGPRGYEPRTLPLRHLDSDFDGYAFRQVVRQRDRCAVHSKHHVRPYMRSTPPTALCAHPCLRVRLHMQMLLQVPIQPPKQGERKGVAAKPSLCPSA